MAEVSAPRRERFTYGSQEDLIARVVNSRDPIVYLVGSAISCVRGPEGAYTGIPDVNKMIEMIQAKYAGTQDHDRLAGILARCPEDERYQTAFEFMINTRGQNAANELVREAVLETYGTALREEIDSSNHPALEEAERDLNTWVIPPAITQLTAMVRKYRDIHRPIIMTSNFDPLIEIALRRQREFAITVATSGDNSIESVTADGIHVIHYHGYWRGTETLHTNRHIKQRRDNLRASLKDILRRNTVIVLGYGGWDDAFMTSVRELHVSECQGDLLWGFFDQDEAKIARIYQHRVLEPLAARYDAGRYLFYKGVNIHSFFKELTHRLAHEHLVRHKVRTREEAQQRARKTLDNRDDTAILTYPGSGRSEMLQFLEQHHNNPRTRVIRLTTRDFLGGTIVKSLSRQLGAPHGQPDAALPDIPIAPGDRGPWRAVLATTTPGFDELVVFIDDYHDIDPDVSALGAEWLRTLAATAQEEFGIKITFCITALRDSQEALRQLCAGFPGINALLLDDPTPADVCRHVRVEFPRLSAVAEHIAYWTWGNREMTDALCVVLLARPAPVMTWHVDALIHELFVVAIAEDPADAPPSPRPRIIRRLKREIAQIVDNLARDGGMKQTDTLSVLLGLMQGEARGLRRKLDVTSAASRPLIPYEFVRIRSETPYRLGFRNPIYALIAGLALQQHISREALRSQG